MMRVCSALLLSLVIEMTSSSKSYGFQLQPGDVVLIHLGCYLCEVIARDGGEGYSHSGIVLSSDPEASDQPIIGQSISKTEAISLSQFLSQAKKGTLAAVYRPKELLNAGRDVQKKTEKTLTLNFMRFFEGTGFDPEFLWDNFDSSGRELMYCSEMITKLINSSLRVPLLPKPMSFSDKYFDFWNQYFKGKIPEGRVGTSPGSFVRSTLFEKVAISQIQ